MGTLNSTTLNCWYNLISITFLYSGLISSVIPFSWSSSARARQLWRSSSTDGRTDGYMNEWMDDGKSADVNLYIEALNKYNSVKPFYSASLEDTFDIIETLREHHLEDKMWAQINLHFPMFLIWFIFIDYRYRDKKNPVNLLPAYLYF